MLISDKNIRRISKFFNLNPPTDTGPRHKRKSEGQFIADWEMTKNREDEENNNKSAGTTTPNETTENHPEQFY
jgi:hypothetical protein